MKLRRAVSAFAAIALVSGLAACGGGDEAAPVVAQAEAAAAAPAADAAAPAADAAPKAGLEPGTGADAYKADDPFIAGNVKVKDAPLTISAAGLAFTKQKFTAKPGSTWTLNNADIAIHNVQTDDGLKNPAKFKSPDANPGQKVKFKLPAKKGTYKVICYYHQSMTADFIIK